MEPITVLSLFNGMSCGMLALNNAGIPVKTYYSSEIDKYAIAESQANFPEIVQMGDVTRWKEWDIDWSKIDLLIGGSPCQGLSSAGRQLGLQDPRSMLFYTMIDIFEHIKSINPNVKYIFENVKMKKESLDIFNQYIGTYPVMINSQHYTAHYRQRYYWYSSDDLFVPPALYYSPTLNEILDGGYSDRTKSYCIDANYWKKGDVHQYINKSRRQIVYLHDDFVNVSKEYIVKNYKLHKDYRHLTVIECCRLQGVPDNFFKVSSNTQAYKMLGNGWTVPVISHLLKIIFCI